MNESQGDYETRPMSLETEASLLGAVMRGGRETFGAVEEIIKPEMFWLVSNQIIWGAIKSIYDNGMEIDTVVVGDEIERHQQLNEIGHGNLSGRARLTNIRENGDPRNAETYATQVQDYHFKRHLLDLSGKMAGWSANGRRPREIIKDIENEFSKITLYDITANQHTASMTQAVRAAYDWTSDASEGKIIGVPTGFIDLDKMLGSLYGGNLYLIGARPGQGKTAFLLTIAKHAAQKHNKKVLIFSIEMSREQVAHRIIAQEAEIAVDKIIKGKLLDSEWPLYTNAVDVVSDLPITINDLSAISIAQIRQEARKTDCDLILVDYIQLAQSSKKNERRDLDIGEISRGLKALSRELNVPVFAAAQLSRNLEGRADKRPMLSDLRESGDLENDADVVMFIYRPDQYEKDAAKQNKAEIIVAKHRNGPVGSVDLIFRGEFTKFENAATKMFNPKY